MVSLSATIGIGDGRPVPYDIIGSISVPVGEAFRLPLASSPRNDIKGRSASKIKRSVQQERLCLAAVANVPNTKKAHIERCVLSLCWGQLTVNVSLCDDWIGPTHGSAPTNTG